MTTISYPCEGCGKTVVRAIGDEGRGRFCSIACGRAHQLMPTREERFWRKVIRGDGCWIWSGSTNPSGYGVLYSGPRSTTRQELAHRVSWELHNGPIPVGKNVCHHCDNPPCVRPGHLFVGDDLDNMRDRDVKGRHGSAKLQPRDVRSIRARFAQGERLRTIAADFGIGISQTSDIANRKAWKHVE